MLHSSFLARWSGGAVAAIASMLLLSACPPAAEVKPEEQFVLLRPECPVDSVIWQDTVLKTTNKFTTLGVSGRVTLIPEFNDCQRFPIMPGTNYGPLVAIFARDSLRETYLEIQHLEASNLEEKALSVAIILSYDGNYPALGIKTGFNCLYMYSKNHGGNFESFVLPVPDEAACLRPLKPSPLPTGALGLPVQRRNVSAVYKGIDYPQVARWDWDSPGQRQYIAIGCLDRWCEVGNNIHESPKYDDASLSGYQRKKMQIKGWYDEEYLAVNKTSGVGLDRSEVVGTLIPAGKLESLALDDYTLAKWPTVAFASLSDDVPSYKTKLNFERSPMAEKKFNVIAFCHGTMAQCNINPSEISKPCAKPTDPWFGDEWYARITAAQTQKVAYRCVIRRKHPYPDLLSRIAGVVRWRWQSKDQTGWIACPDGCCEVIDE